MVWPQAMPQRAVAIGVGAIGFLDESVARHLFHRPQHRLIADPAAPQDELKHHLFRRARAGGHAGSPRGKRSAARAPIPKFARQLLLIRVAADPQVDQARDETLFLPRTYDRVPLRF